MRSSTKELKSLIPTQPSESSLLSSIPLATSALILTCTSLSLILSLYSSGFVKLEKLFQTSTMSTGLLMSSIPGFFTVLTFHFLIINKLRPSDSFFYVAFSCISGTLAQISLVLLGFSLAEKNFLTNEFIEEEEEFVLAVFMASSVVFETLSLNLLLEFGGVLSKNEKTWVCLKIALVGLILFGSFFQGAMAVLLQVIDENWLRLAFDITQYSMFFLHTGYFSTFCYDLQDIRLTVDLKQEYEDSDLEDSIKNNDFRYFKDLLDDGLTGIPSITNESSENIFHVIPSLCKTEKILMNFVAFSVDLIKERFGIQALVKLMNMRSTAEECLTPLHVAITRCRRKITKKYLELGADPRVKSDLGQNSVHLSSKFSLFSILLHLVNFYGMNLHSTDNDGMTPLELAIQSNHEEMALLILSLSKQPDEKKRQTLGLAVRTGSYRITRHLLAHTRYESFEIVETSKKCENKDIEKLLVRANQRNKGNKGKDRWKFWLLLFGIFTKESFRWDQILIYRQKLHKENFLVIESSIQAALLIGAIISLIVVRAKDPGFEGKGDLALSVTAIQELYEKYRPEFVCPYCSIKKHKDTRHCVICQKCVRMHDHHCKWINNCIGKKNYPSFISFLLFFAVDISTDTAICLYDIVFHRQYELFHIYEFESDHVQLYLLIFGLVVNFSIILVLFPVLFKQIKSFRNSCKKKVKVQKKLLIDLDEKEFEQPPNDEVSDTASMFLKESGDRDSLLSV